MALYFGDIEITAAGEVAIPTPQIHLRTTAGAPQVAVSYIPTPDVTWLQRNPEVWLFAYRRPRKNRGIPNPGAFVHPTHVTRREDETAVYAGKSKRKTVETTYTTEFPFVFNNRAPLPYEQVPLTGFNHFEFYWHRAEDRRPTAADFPAIKVGANSPILCPRMAGLRTRFQFRFVIDHPDPTVKFFKLFSPPSVVLHCLPIYSGTFRTTQPDPAQAGNARIVRFRFTV